LVTFGGIELGLGFSQKGTLEAAVRTGARSGSAQHSDPTMPSIVASRVNAGLSGSSLGEVRELWVYRDTGTAPGVCDVSTDCALFKPDVTKGNKQFKTSPEPGTDWLPATVARPINRNGCGNTPDRVHVSLRGTYKWLTGLIGTGNLTLTADNIQALEPTNC
jgi:hypothetical protein